MSALARTDLAGQVDDGAVPRALGIGIEQIGRRAGGNRAQLVAALLARNLEAADQVVRHRAGVELRRTGCVWLSRIVVDRVARLGLRIDQRCRCCCDEARRRIDRIAGRHGHSAWCSRGGCSSDRSCSSAKVSDVAPQLLVVALEQAVIIVIIDRRRLVAHIRRGRCGSPGRTGCHSRAHCPDRAARRDSDRAGRAAEAERDRRRDAERCVST